MPTTLVEVPTLEVDLGEMAREMVFPEPDDQLVLPWGDGPGLAGHDHLTGVWSLDVADDGAVVVVHVGDDQGYGPRVQLWDGEPWRILVETDDDSEFLPYGVAALDTGPILVHGLRRGSGGAETATAFLYARDGTLLDEGRVPVITNQRWGGGEHAWSAIGPGSAPYQWLQLTDGEQIVGFGDAEMDAIDAEVERLIDEALPFFPLERQLVYYQDSRIDSGVEFQVEGGQGWDNTNSLDPFLVAVTTDDATRRWSLSNWDNTVPMIWEADNERFIAVALHTPPDGEQDHVVVDCPLDGDCAGFLVVNDYWRESNSWDSARLHNGDLYVLQATPEEARIDIFHLQPADGIRPVSHDLTVTTANGWPGEPLEVCGTYHPYQEIQIVMHKADTDLAWPSGTPEIVTSNGLGEFCWTGTIPTEMEDQITNEVTPISTDIYELVARDTTTGQDFAMADIAVGEP